MLHKGNQVQVSVDSVFPFGVFCHLVSDGSQGYIRRRELSLSGQTGPRQPVKPGDEQAVVVANLPTAERMIELSWRRAQPDPWLAFGRQTQPGDVATGIVKYVHPDRVSVEILPGVDGMILLDDLSSAAVQRPEEVVWPGDRVEGWAK